MDKLKIEADIEDKLLEDVPDEFLCGMMQTIMKDPVKLPETDIIVDKSTIE